MRVEEPLLYVGKPAVFYTVEPFEISDLCFAVSIHHSYIPVVLVTSSDL